MWKDVALQLQNEFPELAEWPNFSYRIFARPPERSSVSWSSYTRPFSRGLWVALGLSLISLAIFFWLISHWYLKKETARQRAGERRMGREKEREKRNLEAVKKDKVSEGTMINGVSCQTWKKDSPFVMWAAITQQGWPETPERGGLRAIFCTGYVMGVVVVAAYSATLVSFLTVAGDGLPFDSLGDLKRLRNHRLGILKGSILEEYFRNPHFREYWESLIEPYSDTLATSYDELRANAKRDSSYAYVGSYEVQRLDPVGACTFKSTRQHLFFNDGALGWPRSSPYVQLFDHFINKFRETGLMNKMMAVWYSRPYSCPIQSVIPLGFKQVFTAFVMLGIGAAVSLIFLTFEKLKRPM